MVLYECKGKRPVLGKGTWIAPTAAVIGEVTIGKECYIGFGAVIRADFGPITIGDGSIVEDNAVIHTGARTTIGNQVIIAHQAMVHDARIGDRVLVGMQALVGDDVVIQNDVWIAEQAHVRKGTVIESGRIVGGRPAVSIGKVTQARSQNFSHGLQAYSTLRGNYQAIQKPEWGNSGGSK